MLGARNRTTSSVLLSDPSKSGNRETKALGLNQAVPCWSTGSLQVGPGTGHWRNESNNSSFDNHLKAMCKKRMLFASSTLSVCKEETGEENREKFLSTNFARVHKIDKPRFFDPQRSAQDPKPNSSQACSIVSHVLVGVNSPGCVIRPGIEACTSHLDSTQNSTTKHHQQCNPLSNYLHPPRLP